MKNYIIIGLVIIGLLFLINLKLGFWKTSNKAITPSNSVEYFTTKSPERDFGKIACGLFATFKGKRYEIINCGEEGMACIMLDTVMDFDGDGLNDALIEDLNGGCGSAYVPSSYFICSPEKNMEFRTTENFGGEGYGTIHIEEWDNNPSIVLSSSIEGVGHTELSATIERFILKSGRVIRTEKKDKKPILSISELTSAKVAEDGQYLLVNLDNDKLRDTIFGEYWDRWGAMMWRIGFGDGKFFDGNGYGRKRVGVLFSRTNGVNDIVLDFDDILVWDGEKYVDKDKK